MAEIRIPTDKIPMDILHRLQAMIPSLQFSKGQGYMQDSVSGMGVRKSPNFFASSSHDPSANCPNPTSATKSPGWRSDNQHSVIHGSDEVDGDDTVVHAVSLRPTTKVTSEVMDDSGIVRIFPSPTRTASNSGSDIVRIFDSEEMKAFRGDGRNGAQKLFENNFVRMTSSSTSDPQHFDCKEDKSERNSSRCVNNSNNVSNSQPAGSGYNTRQHGCVAAPTSKTQTAGVPEIRVSAPEPRPSKNQLFYLPATREGMVGAPSPNGEVQMVNEGSCISGHLVDEEADPEDDEVFRLDIGSRSGDLRLSKYSNYQADQIQYETTPVREIIASHYESEPIKRRISPSNSALKHPDDAHFGDRLGSRKRLSFDDAEDNSPVKVTKVCPSVYQQSMLFTASSSETQCSSPQYHNRGASGQKQAFSYPHFVSSDQQKSPNTSRSGQTLTSEKSACRSPVSEIMQFLEQVSSKHVQASGDAPRARFKSDGDLGTLDSTVGQLNQHRGHSFSCGSRIRQSSYYSGEDSGQCSSELLREQDHGEDEAHEDCQCAMIKKYVLQMAENAYRRINKMDGTVEDFERFRTQLATTNNLLRESMANIHSFKTICRHKSRNSSASSTSSAIQNSTRHS